MSRERVEQRSQTGAPRYRRCCTRRASLGRDHAFVAAFLLLALLEIMCVIPLTLLMPWSADDHGIIHAFLCEGRRKLHFSVLITLYLLLNTLPWIAGFVVEALQQRTIRMEARWEGVRMRDFLVASPRIGFLIALQSLTVIVWRDQVRGVRSRCCTRGAGICDLTQLTYGEGEVALSIFLIGLSAWAASVWCSLTLSVTRQLPYRWARRLTWSLLVLVIVLLLVFFVATDMASWMMYVHVELGVLVWVVASLLFYAEDLSATLRRRMARRLQRSDLVETHPHTEVTMSVSLLSFHP